MSGAACSTQLSCPPVRSGLLLLRRANSTGSPSSTMASWGDATRLSKAAITVQTARMRTGRSNHAGSTHPASRPGWSKRCACAGGQVSKTVSKRPSAVPSASCKCQPPSGARSTRATSTRCAISRSVPRRAGIAFMSGVPVNSRRSSGKPCILPRQRCSAAPIIQRRMAQRKSPSVAAIAGAPWSKASSSRRRVAQRPPMFRPLSNSRTDRPLSCHRRAAVSPAMPAPMMARRGDSAAIVES